MAKRWAAALSASMKLRSAPVAVAVAVVTATVAAVVAVAVVASVAGNRIFPQKAKRPGKCPAFSLRLSSTIAREDFFQAFGAGGQVLVGNTIEWRVGRAVEIVKFPLAGLDEQ